MCQTGGICEIHLFHDNHGFCCAHFGRRCGPSRSTRCDGTDRSGNEMEFARCIGLARPRASQFDRDPNKAGPYTLRLKFPAGFKIGPHTHPDSREVTILSGTWYTGYGEKADPAGLKALPAGSFYTEPANVAHYVEVREPTIIQVSGTGPSGRKNVGPDAAK